jgi:hypothetical protein
MVGQTGIAVNLAFGSRGPRRDEPEEGELVCPAMDVVASPVSELRNFSAS